MEKETNKGRLIVSGLVAVFAAFYFGAFFGGALSALGLGLPEWLAYPLIFVFVFLYIYLKSNTQQIAKLLKDYPSDRPVRQQEALKQLVQLIPGNSAAAGGLADEDEEPEIPGSIAERTGGEADSQAYGEVIRINDEQAASFTGKLSHKKKYLQIALNGSMAEARAVINQLPRSEKILIEAGTPLIKTYGAKAIREIRSWLPAAYIVADGKTADLAEREVNLYASYGASAATVLGVAPTETIDEFIKACRDNQLDSMIDMMNVAEPLAVLKKLKYIPTVVILHRGVDETESVKDKMIPYYQINQIKGGYDVLVSVAGGDSEREIQSSILSGADIVVAWKGIAEGGDMKALVEGFLKEIK